MAFAVGMCGCGGSTHAGVPADAGPEAAPNVCGQPPPPPSSSLSSPVQAQTYAIEEFFMGDVAPSGSVDPGAWKTTGFDLDRFDTTDPSSHPNCVQPDVAFLLDGHCGIDNGLGQYLTSFPAAMSPSQTQTAQAKAGQWTLLLSIAAAASGSTSTAIGGALFVGAPLTAPPRFDGSDVWPPTTDSAAGSPGANAWTDGYMVGQTLYVTGSMTVPFDFAQGAGVRKRVTLQIQIIQADIATGGGSITGVLAGIVPPSSVPTLFASCAGPPTYYTDIMSNDGVSPMQACDSTSLGIGFTARAVKLGQPGPGLPAPTPCKGSGG